MLVTKIAAQQKDSNRVSIYIDGEYSVSLTLDQLLAEKLKVGAQLDANDIKRLTKLSEDGKLRARALEWVMVRPRSASELRLYLIKKKADAVFIDALLLEFLDKNYQNDESFAHWWVENRVRKNKSDIAIRAELLQKGIAKEIIDAVLQSASPQQQRLRELVAQKRNLPKYQADPLKFKKFLLSKGFNYSDIDEVLAEDIGAEDGNF